MNRIVAGTVFLFTTSAVAQSPCKSSVTGDLQIDSFQSIAYRESQTLRVWLPPGYNDPANSQKKYPVLYLLDGQNAFDSCTSFDGKNEWHVDESLTRLIAENRIEHIIVVGIDSGPRRIHQYSPYKDTVTRAKEPEPIGKLLPMYIGSEVLPYISARYRVTSEAGRTGIGGASMGGAAALYVLLNRLDLFSLGLIESPSLQIGNGQLLRDTSFLVLGPDRVYIGVGTTEFAGGGEQMASKMRLSFERLNAAAVKMSETLATNLKSAYVNEPDVQLVIEPNATHTQVSWARRFPAAVTFLYRKDMRKQ